jgi:VanZ family protein
MTSALRYRNRWMSLGWLMLGIILVMSVLPIPEQPGAPLHSDKFLHALVFAALMLWFSGLVSRRQLPQVFLLLVVYGACMEVMQSFTTYRMMDAGDLVADCLGLLIGWALAALGGANWCRWLEAKFF